MNTTERYGHTITFIIGGRYVLKKVISDWFCLIPNVMGGLNMKQGFDEKISDVRYLSVRLQAYVEANGTYRASELMNSSNADIKKYCSGGRMKMITLDNLTELLGLSVAELMLIPGMEDDLEWYRDASREYLHDNLRSYAKAAGITQKELSHLTGIDRRSVNNYFCGQVYPMTDKLQSMADALGVEVADLFLPTE